MITQKDIIKCESVFSDDMNHRFILKRVWDKEKPLAAIIMLNPAFSDNILVDTSTALVVNNIARLERFGGVEIVNLYSILTKKLNFKFNSDEDLNDPQNDIFIKKAAEECSVFILAYGKTYDSNYRITERADSIIAMLNNQKEKLFVISDGERESLHPLTPSLRKGWILKPYIPKTETPIISDNDTTLPVE